MANQARQNGRKEDPSAAIQSLIAPQYLESVGDIISQRLVSSLRTPSCFTVSRGFVVPSRAEAVSAIERFVSFEKQLRNKQDLEPWLGSIRNSSSSYIEREFPEHLLSNRPLLLYYGGCAISPFGSSQVAVQFGDGIIPHELQMHMQLPAMVVAEQRHFLLEQIPHTKGAKAFSTSAAAITLADLLRSHQDITITNVTPDLTSVYKNEAFVTSLEIIFSRSGSEHYHNDLVIFPCAGMDIPRQFRERLVLTVTPALTPQFETTEQMLSLSAKLLEVTSIITSGLQELFGTTSPRRVKSVAPIPTEPQITAEKHFAGFPKQA